MALSWRPRGAVADVLVALAVAAVLALYPLVSRTDLTPMWPYGHLLLLLAPAALLWRRRHPVPVLLLEMALTSLYFANGYPEVPIYVACIVALYTVADRTHPLIAVACGALVVAGAVWQELRSAMSPEDILMITGWLLMVIAFGAAARNRRAYLVVAERRAVIEERLRIARDVHDAVGHAMSLINVQAGAALHRIADRPEKAREALAAIKQASAEALRELRATVGELRQDPGLGELGRLVDNARRAGLEVRLRQPREVRLRPEVDLAAYRIVQEALTNTARHAGATHVRVELAVAGGELTIDVEDDGANASGGTEGSGLTGMAERVARLGGTLEYGPLDGGGFRVRATLPAGDDRAGRR
ncbi:sensor histidine kinase [Nonomuraea sp. SYSU D8015]|uniref:sensor histidine kinase n=1 Tax=Nonomuraea sp. SYSU D8015 TaxID=2593644 RepID=UPI001660F800|nr:sensor histidine kinase [Nonomuraea sp. SYSU D8015]